MSLTLSPILSVALPTLSLTSALPWSTLPSRLRSLSLVMSPAASLARPFRSSSFSPMVHSPQCVGDVRYLPEGSGGKRRDGVAEAEANTVIVGGVHLEGAVLRGRSGAVDVLRVGG